MKDWGYVFDRNGDGLADYLCFLDGPISVRQRDVPTDFPRKKQRLTGEQMQALLFATKYAFYHIVDEDFDGSVDLIVHSTFEQDSPFVEKSVALRWRKSQRLIGSSWYFEEDPSVKAGKPKVGGNDHWVRLWPHMHETLPFTANDFSRLAELLSAVNLAATECKPWARGGD